ncbi:hypothetical protein SDC9_140217 [bioreactor metagenome]|uniref:Uncharacterized protein n=1 Tax=bioreactor metagenome TaxID=1076179 RepID=A0A645DUS8_9ZZZZ
MRGRDRAQRRQPLIADLGAHRQCLGRVVAAGEDRRRPRRCALGQSIQVDLHSGGQLSTSRRFGHQCGDRCPAAILDGLQTGAQHLGIQGRLGAEIAVEQRFGRLRLPGDLGHRDLFVGFGREGIGRSGQDVALAGRRIKTAARVAICPTHGDIVGLSELISLEGRAATRQPVRDLRGGAP